MMSGTIVDGGMMSGTIVDGGMMTGTIIDGGMITSGCANCSQTMDSGIIYESSVPSPDPAADAAAPAAPAASASDAPAA